jgi:hypothetical protein
MSDPGTSRAMVWGWILLSVFLPLGLTLEALHALKVPTYLNSEMRRELWTLSHAHGNLLGLLCLSFAALGERAIADPAARSSVARWLVLGSVLMPAGFFLGGILNHEGDPSLGILLVPLGAACLLYALVRTAIGPRAG